MERICPTHGTGHPDPDDYRIVSGEDSGQHGCCGCCLPTVTKSVQEVLDELGIKFSDREEADNG